MRSRSLIFESQRVNCSLNYSYKQWLVSMTSWLKTKWGDALRMADHRLFQRIYHSIYQALRRTPEIRRGRKQNREYIYYQSRLKAYFTEFLEDFLCIVDVCCEFSQPLAVWFGHSFHLLCIVGTRQLAFSFVCFFPAGPPLLFRFFGLGFMNSLSTWQPIIGGLLFRTDIHGDNHDHVLSISAAMNLDWAWRGRFLSRRNTTLFICLVP